jgi:hypothetical protein
MVFRPVLLVIEWTQSILKRNWYHKFKFSVGQRFRIRLNSQLETFLNGHLYHTSRIRRRKKRPHSKAVTVFANLLWEQELFKSVRELFLWPTVGNVIHHLFLFPPMFRMMELKGLPRNVNEHDPAFITVLCLDSSLHTSGCLRFQRNGQISRCPY